MAAMWNRANSIVVVDDDSMVVHAASLRKEGSLTGGSPVFASDEQSTIASRATASVCGAQPFHQCPSGISPKNEVAAGKADAIWCNADIPVCGFTGLSSPVFGNWRLESRQNPQAGKPALPAHRASTSELGLRGTGIAHQASGQRVKAHVESDIPVWPF
jgi:hypothetical protein